MAEKRQNYGDEFKQEAARLMTDYGRGSENGLESGNQSDWLF